MSGVTFVNETFVPAPLYDAFSSFGTGTGPGWLMSAVARRLEEGAALDLIIPANGRTLRATARVMRLIPLRTIVIRHETPWEGETSLTFRPVPGGTMVRAVSTLPEAALAWIGETIVAPVSPTSTRGDEVAVGLITSLSGESGFVGRAVTNCAILAVEEINASGGVGGKELQLHVLDDETSSKGAAKAIDVLVATQVIAAVGMHTSLSLSAVEPIVHATRLPYLYAAPHEMDQRSGTLFRLGGSIHRRVDSALASLVGALGAPPRIYLIGNDYSWPRRTLEGARSACERANLAVVGETLVPLEADTDFERIVDDIILSGANLVVSALIGFASVDFERAFSSAGLRDDITTFSALLDEPTLDLLGADGEGIWSCVTYFRDLPTPGNAPFLSRYRERFGARSPAPSALSVPVYESIHLIARAASQVAAGTSPDLSSAIAEGKIDGPRGRIALRDGRCDPPVYLVQATGAGLRLARALGSAR